jgi:hypothetical protein
MPFLLPIEQLSAVVAVADRRDEELHKIWKIKTFL